jgi:MFS family permease
VAKVALGSDLPVQTEQSEQTEGATARRRVLGAAVAGYAFDGVDLMVIALTLPLLMKEWGITMVQGGVIVSAMLIGSCVGGYVFGPLADKYGRTRALTWCIISFGIATGLGGFAQNYLQLAGLRFLAGIGLGAEWALGATLVAEFYPAKQRATANSWMQMGWPLGYGCAIAAQYLLVPSYGWRSLYFVGALAVLVGLYIHYFVPESPVWLKSREGRDGLQSTTSAPRSSDLFRAPHLRPYIYATLLLISALMAYWSVNSWLPTILQKERAMGMVAMSSFLLGLNAVSIPAYFIAGHLGDKYGKRLVTSASALIAAATLYLWLAFSWDELGFWSLGLIHWAMASAMWAGLAAFVAEQFPTSIRALGLSSAFATGRAVVVFVPMALGAAAMSTGLTTALAFVAVFYLIAACGALMLKDESKEM